VPAVLVRFRVPGQTAEYDAGKLGLCPRDRVVLDSERGLAVGTVIRAPEPRRPSKPLRRVLRVITDEDERVMERTRVREREAHQFCAERIKARGLPMKLVAVDLAHSGTRAVFYFSSADRVDFRALVKDLARRFHTRIEMRQVGVRDASRHTGGIGICGRELCCACWLPGFKPISIRMAKDQNLALNQQKLSGLCGRLRCCLQYEQEIYQKQRKGLPKVGKRVFTPQGEGRVKDVNVLQRCIRVQLAEGGYAQFDVDEVQRPGDVSTRGREPGPAPAKPPAEPPATSDPQEQAAAPNDEAKPDRPRRRRRRRGRRGRSRKGDGGRGGNDSSGRGPPKNG
jgi:cell fate regulator YaaT (PSP1 superfamily)